MTDELQPEQLAALWVGGQPVAYVAAALWRGPTEGEAGWSLLISEAHPAMPDGEMDILLRTRDGVSLRGHARLAHAGERAIKTDLISGIGPLVEIGSEPN
jgi:hypothetical protein